MQLLSRKNIEYLGSQQRFISLPGFLLVLAAHAALFYFIWNQRLIPQPEQMVTLFAELITSPMPEPAPQALPEPTPVKLQPAKKPVVKPKQERLAVKSPTPKREYVEPQSEPLSESVETKESTPAAAAPPTQMPAEPITLSSELSVSCPKLTAPAYPAISRRMGEEGKLVLRVELDENGRIDNAKVIDSSGYERLDTAALTAVKTWQCNPSLRNGQPIRAVALQPFNFVLQGN
ncbi:energy transducer TonB [Nitrosomonas sp. Nm166]|uniref:energy transducer TonB n=1 Tax=Nitrosomonas sp. Nm166 TaxID=1881054 RepID=UPI0008E252E4|nr:energy transducer TonB [Nitrosomonas sp. Nm166]SFE17320.1 protein TonB [Nitrosomonas sp. Nm166]